MPYSCTTCLQSITGFRIAYMAYAILIAASMALSTMGIALLGFKDNMFLFYELMVRSLSVICTALTVLVACNADIELPDDYRHCHVQLIGQLGGRIRIREQLKPLLQSVCLHVASRVVVVAHLLIHCSCEYVLLERLFACPGPFNIQVRSDSRRAGYPNDAPHRVLSYALLVALAGERDALARPHARALHGILCEGVHGKSRECHRSLMNLASIR
jgi:hypothetical protein